MATYKPTIPSRQQAWYLISFIWCTVHFVAFYSIFNEMSSLLTRFPLGEIVGAIAYSLLYAFAECVIIGLLLVVVNTILPSQWGGTWYAVRGLWMYLLLNSLAIRLDAPEIQQWLLFGLAVLAILGIGFVAARYSKIRALLNDLLNRLGVLAGLFMFFDVASLLIVIWRNIW